MIPEIIYGRFELWPQELKDRVAKELSNQMLKLIHLNSNEVETFLKVKYRTLKKERLVGTKFGRRIRPSLQDILDYVEKNKTEIPDATNIGSKEFQAILNKARDKIVSETLIMGGGNG